MSKQWQNFPLILWRGFGWEFGWMNQYLGWHEGEKIIVIFGWTISLTTTHLQFPWMLLLKIYISMLKMNGILISRTKAQQQSFFIFSSTIVFSHGPSLWLSRCGYNYLSPNFSPDVRGHRALCHGTNALHDLLLSKCHFCLVLQCLERANGLGAGACADGCKRLKSRWRWWTRRH